MIESSGLAGMANVWFCISQDRLLVVQMIPGHDPHWSWYGLKGNSGPGLA
jgi:hypothetical protein